MSELVAKRTRVLAVLIVAVFAFSAVQSMAFDTDSVPTVSAAATEYEVKVGWLSDIINWNPMVLAMVEDWVACFLMYSALWQYDEKWDQPVGDLATSYNMTYHPDGTMTLWVNLTHNAYFRNADNPTDTSLGFTAADVVYSFETAKSKQSTAWEYYLRDYDNITAVNDYTVRMDIPYAKATVIDDLTGIPIVNDNFYEDNNIQLTGAMNPDQCLGTGPFMYDSHLEGGWYKFKKVGNYHGELDYGEERSVKIDYITYELSANAGELAVKMNAGNLDVCVLTGEPDVYVNDILGSSNPDIEAESVQELGICDIAINGVPLEFRIDAPGSGNDYNDGNYHLLDKEVRKAILMTLNKTFINKGIMKGLSVEADSVIWPGYWQADLTGVLEYDTDAARQVLLDAGYVDDGSPYLKAGPTSEFMLNNYDELSDDSIYLEGIRCHAPNTDPSYGDITDAWAGWAAEAGIGFSSEVINEAIMINEEWYKCMYDIWVWHWGWGPEPLSDLSVWLTDEITVGGDNCQGPMGPWWYWESLVDRDAYSAFDENFTLAKEAINKDERKVYVDRLQQFVYDSYCETPPYYDVGLYGYSTARYQGWGDWSQNSGRTIVSGMPWLWFDLLPAGNLIPEIDPGLQSNYELDVDEIYTFEITVSDPDGDSLWVNWTFGDGSDPVENTYASVSSPTVVSASHSYSEESTYTVTVTVTDGYAFHTVTDTASVLVSSIADAAPTLSGLVYSPSSAYVNEETTWSVTAQDAEATTMTLTFSWGDGSYTVRTLTPSSVGTAVSVTGVTHTFTSANDYTVRIYLWDGFDVPTNTIHNISISRTYSVIDNTAPTAPVVVSVNTVEDKWTPISATTRDADPDVLRVTWNWGDGTYNVTTHDTSSAPGVTVTSSVKHLWADPDTYSFTVWVDDGNGHNVSTTASATVNPEGTNLGPTSISLVQSPEPGYVDEPVTLTIGAFDPNGDALLFTVELGDGEIAVESTTGGDEVQTIEIEHTYTYADVFTVYVSVDDGAINVTADEFFVTISEPAENSPPEIVLQSAYTAMYNETFTLTPVLVSDDDGDTLSVWYDWGDDTPITAGNPAAAYAGTHEYSVTGTMTVTVSVSDGTGLIGHNVSETSSVSVNYNRRPTVKSIVKDPLTGPYLEGETIFFNVTVSDKEGNDVTVKIRFGDDTAVESITESLAGPEANVTVSFSHAYEDAESYTVTVWVEDEYDHPDPTWISLTTTVVIEAEDTDGGDSTILYIAIGIVALIVVAVVAMMLMKKRKGGEGTAGESGGMEGMAPPEDVPPPPSQ